MASETLDPVRFDEWTYHEDSSGIVYCLGRQATNGHYEAVATYNRVPNESGTKHSLISGLSYNRLMYHGFAEEDKKLDALSPDAKAQIIGHIALGEHCLFIEPATMQQVPREYRLVSSWLNSDDPRTAPFRRALSNALDILERAGISVANVSLYGGAAFGLVSDTSKAVDDIDVLLNITSVELEEAVKPLQTCYSWDDINPGNILSRNRMMLKAKRWSTSQLRLGSTDPLTIDLKIGRNPSQSSLWNHLPEQYEADEFEGELLVIDDKEAYCTSPAILCEDVSGNERIVLFRGYPYIGCAVRGDKILVRGNEVKETSIVLVSQSERDLLVPDFRNALIS